MSFILSSSPIIRIPRGAKLTISIIMDLLGIALQFSIIASFILSFFAGFGLLPLGASLIGWTVYIVLYGIVGALLYGAPFAVLSVAIKLPLQILPIIAAIPFMTIWYFLSNR